MSTNVLTNRDINTKNPASPCKMDGDQNQEYMSMEYHRKVFQSTTDENQEKATYVSPSDTIMSPCTAKLSAYRNKQVGKAKPKSLFAKTSSKNLGGSSENFFTTPTTKDNIAIFIENTKA